MKEFDIVFKALPTWMPDIDLLQVKTISGLVNQVQFEIDLYDEKEDSAIKTPKQYKEAKAFVKKYDNYFMKL